MASSLVLFDLILYGVIGILILLIIASIARKMSGGKAHIPDRLKKLIAAADHEFHDVRAAEYNASLQGFLRHKEPDG